MAETRRAAGDGAASRQTIRSAMYLKIAARSAARSRTRSLASSCAAVSCSRHGPDRHPSFAVNTEVGYFVDFHDGTGGDSIEFYKRVRGISVKQAIRELAQKFLRQTDDSAG